MRPSPARFLPVVLAASVLASCFHAAPPPPGPSPPTSDVTLSLAPGRNWFNASLPEGGPVRWQLLRGLDVIQEGEAARSGERWVAFSPGTLTGNATWAVRFQQGGALAALRTFTLASPAWAPPGPGSWAFALEPTANTSTRLAGTLRADRDGWRLDAAGTVRASSPNGTLQGAVLHYLVEEANGSAVERRMLLELHRIAGDGTPLGNVSAMRTLVGQGRVEDSQGAPHDALLHRSWSRLTGTLRGGGGTVQVDATTVTEQWTSLSGVPLQFTRAVWDNATGAHSRHSDFGQGDELPVLLSLARGPMPQPLAQGDVFVLPGPLRFEVGAHEGGLWAQAGPQGSLVLAPGGALREYRGSEADGARVLVTVPR